MRLVLPELENYKLDSAAATGRQYCCCCRHCHHHQSEVLLGNTHKNSRQVSPFCIRWPSTPGRVSQEAELSVLKLEKSWENQDELITPLLQPPSKPHCQGLKQNHLVKQKCGFPAQHHKAKHRRVGWELRDNSFIIDADYTWSSRSSAIHPQGRRQEKLYK